MSRGEARLGRLEFGGPDLSERRLRDLLQAHVDAAPAGSRIDWATYYFRDRALAEALILACDRGVRVKLVLESNPRRAGANDAVIAMLSAHGLKGGFHLYSAKGPGGGHMHAKIYAFSEPNLAWTGSFNPSGDVPEDPEVVAEIGDQDRGHNLLLGIERPRLVQVLRRHVGVLAGRNPVPPKFRPHFNWVRRDLGTQLYFLPRLNPCQAEMEIEQLQAGDRVQGAISHLKKGELTKQFRKAVARGVSVQLLVHDTERRVPTKLIDQLLGSGVQITRVVHPDDLPMHAKFILIHRQAESAAWLGSHNFNPKSQTQNAEVLLRTTDKAVVSSLCQRFDEISAMA